MAEFETPVEIMGRELPYSREAEQAIIGSVLTDSKAVAEAAETLSPDNFYYAANKLIFSVVLDLFNENSAIDFVTVSNRLSQADNLDAAGGVEYLRDCALNVPTTHHVSYYSNIIKEKATLRSLISTSGQISKMAYDASDDTGNIIERSEQLIFDIAAGKEKRNIVPIKDILSETYNTMIKNLGAKKGITGVATGFDELNKRTGGLHGGELILIAARPAMGKSSFAINIAEHVAIKDKLTVALFTLEMPKEQVVNRIICSQAMVDSNKINTGSLTGEDWERIGSVIIPLSQAPLYIDDTGSLTVSQIRAKCRMLKQSHGLSLVVVDYLQLMNSGKRSENRQQEISEISRSLKILAKELDVPVIALSQLSRATESRTNKKPMLSDLRESGAIEQDADIVMFLYRESYYNEEAENNNLVDCIIAKHRNGEIGTFKLGWKGEYTQFQNVEYREEEQ